MSFRCGVCHSVSVPGVRATRVVLERRTKIYALGGGLTAEGWEIVRETLADAACAAKTDGRVRKEEEAARKAAAGNATIADVVHAAVVDDLPPSDFMTPEQMVAEFAPKPVVIEAEDTVQTLESVLAKPKKPKRAKKVKKDEETA